MQVQYQAIALPAVGQTSTPILVEDLTGITVFVHQPTTNPASFSLNVQVKVDHSGVNTDDEWVDFFEPADVIQSTQAFTISDGGVPLTVTHLRVSLLALGAGSPPKVVVAGRNTEV